MQGQTIKKPISVVIDLYKANKDAQAYVMLSRAESLQQLIILDGLHNESWRVSKAALAEVKSMDLRALNRKELDRHDYQIISLNIRSLKKHHLDLISDPIILQSDFICLQETWLDEKDQTDLYQIPGFISNFNSSKKGRGIAAFCKKDCPIIHTKNASYQISKLVYNYFDLISIYRSQDEKGEIFEDILKLINTENPTIILGDLNLDIMKFPEHSVLRNLKDLSFKQLVQTPTHEQ